MALDVMKYLEGEKNRRGRIADYQILPEGKQLVKDVIERVDKTDVLVAFSEAFGAFLASRERDLTTSQIRNIFGEVKKIEMDWQRNPEGSWVRLQLLRPKLAYAARKADKPGAFALKEMLSEAILHVNGKAENFERFVNFFEAILAYHKAAGGR